MPQSPDPHPNSETPWSAEQRTRLEYEWRRLQRSYAFHPIVRVVPLEGDPPAVYQIDYRVRTLEINAAGQLGYAATCSVQVVLPVDFPHSPPLVKPMQAIFHPNVDSESIQIFPPWNPSTTLADVVDRVGRLLAFQAYDPQDVWNPVAMEWAVANAAYVPTDPSADVAPEAGGNPLERICRSGPAALPSLREQVRKFCDSMLGPINPPGASEVRYFALRTRLAAGMFLDSDIPEALSKQASELDEWAAALPAAEAGCARFRRVAAAAQGAAATADLIAEAAKRLNLQLHATRPLCGDGLPSNPTDLLACLPAAAELQQAHAALRASLARAEQKLEAARATLASLDDPAPGGKFPAPLQVLMDAETGHKRAMVKDARGHLETKLAGAEPIVSRARREAGALERMLQWREFTDTGDRAAELAAKVLEWGAGGVQAFYLDNDAGVHGPFDFEQLLELGAAQVVVRKVSQHAVEAVELVNGTVLGRCESGNLSVVIPGAGGGGGGEGEPEGFAATFQVTPRCDDLALQLEYAVARTRSLLERFGTPDFEEPAASWNGSLVAALSEPGTLSAIRAGHEARSTGWADLVGDLRSLAPFKERLATYHLLVRVQETLPRYQKERADASAALKKVAERVAAILKRSTKDLESGRAIIPGKFHKEYEGLLDQSDRLQAVKDRLAVALKNSAAHVQARMAVKKGAASPIGSARAPVLKALPAMPVDVGELSAAMSDAAILGLVTDIEGMLNTQLYFGRRPSAPKLIPAAPVEAAPPAAMPAATNAAESASPEQPEIPAEETAHPEVAPEAETVESTPYAHAEDWPAAGDPGHGHADEHPEDGFAVHAEHDSGEPAHENDDVFVDWPK